jgi:hypothetical protein
VCTRDEVNSLLKLKKDSVLRILGGSKVEALDTYKFFQVRRMSKFERRSVSDRWISFKIPERRRIVGFVFRQEERTEEEDKFQALDPSAGYDHHWIKENLYVL